jgi:glycosyltransferase involved in cell wall biosynthesis
VEALIQDPGRVARLPPFLDPGPYRVAALNREAHRARLSESQQLDALVPWIVVAAMMRPGDKLASYEMLAASLGAVADLSWQMLVVGDGTAREAVEAAFRRTAPGRVRFLGERNAEDLAAIYAASDLCVWPAVNEAYGMAMLEAQAAGIPVVSRAVRGVPDVVLDGVTGLLAPTNDADALGRLTRLLLLDASRRVDLGRAAARFVAEERSIETAAFSLDRALRGLCNVRSQ